MISLAAYEMDYNEDEDVWYIRVGENLICPVCTCENLVMKGWRKRNLTLLDDTGLVLMVRRVRCKNCNKIHHVLPDTIVPYKRHDLETIEKIMQGKKSETFCEESLINRIKAWWQKLLLYLTLLETITQCQIPQPTEQQLPKLVRILVNVNRWPRTRNALGIG